jgi:hypothetical protein
MARSSKSTGGAHSYKFRVFLSSSWEALSPEPAHLSDLDITVEIQRLIKKLDILELVNPREHSPESIRDKIQDGIDSADVVLCIFTKRLKSETVDGNCCHLPSTYVLSEAAFALGRFQNYEGRKRVIGFYEEGVDLSQLGLFREYGTDFVPFSRAKFKETLPEFKKYLSLLPERLRSGSDSGQGVMIGPEYRQLFVRKRARVYRKGSGMIRLLCRALILDAAQVKSNGITHWIRSQRSSFPNFSTMLETHVRNRTKEAFFSAVVISINGRHVNTPPIVELVSASPKDIRFRIRFPDDLRLRDNDIVEYQYAWGLPDLFASNAEELGPEVVDSVDLTTTHGPIREAELLLEVEREARGVRRASPFSKEPFLRLSPRVEPFAPLSEPLPVPYRDESMWYLVYHWAALEFFGTVKISWKPLSKEHWLTRRRPPAAPAD